MDKNITKIIIAGLFLILSFLNINCEFLEKDVLKDETSNAYTMRLIEAAPTLSDLPDVPAVYLLIKQRYYVKEDCSTISTIHVVFKVLRKQGLSMGEISIPFEATDSTLDITLARTITPEGKIINVSEEDIKEISLFSEFPLYDNVKLKQFSMPAMEEGCIIEYKAVLKVRKPQMPDFFRFYWSFPPGVPVQSATFEVNVPEDMKVRTRSRKLHLDPAKVTKKHRKIYKWEADYVFLDGGLDPLLPPYDLVCPNLTFIRAKKWADMRKWFYDISKTQIVSNDEMQKLVKDIVNKNNGHRKKIMQDLYYYVSQNIRYVSIPLDSSYYKPHTAVDVYMNRYGDCKDKSALLITLLKLAGIEARFALLRTRSQGPIIRKFPALDFNHCIVAVPEIDEYTYLDPTLEFGRFGYMPNEMRDVYIFIVGEEDYHFEKLPLKNINISGSKSVIEMGINDNDNSIDVSERTDFFGMLEVMLRSNFAYSPEEAVRAECEKALHKIFTSVSLVDISFQSPKDLDQKFNTTVRYTVRDHIKKAGNLLIFDFPEVFERYRVLISREERNYPIWFPEYEEETMTFIITIPANYRIKHLLPDITEDTIFGFYKRNVSLVRDKVEVTYYYKTKMLEISSDEYKRYKEFIGYMLKTSDESIIFELAAE